MLPLMPYSTLTRTTQFVTEEWDVYFADGAADPASDVVGGWKGILYANLAIIDPTTSWNFFNQSDFDSSWLDGGASRTWYLAYAAGSLPPFPQPSSTASISLTEWSSYRSWRIGLRCVAIMGDSTRPRPRERIWFLYSNRIPYGRLRREHGCMNNMREPCGMGISAMMISNIMNEEITGGFRALRIRGGTAFTGVGT